MSDIKLCVFIYWEYNDDLSRKRDSLSVSDNTSLYTHSLHFHSKDNIYR